MRNLLYCDLRTLSYKMMYSYLKLEVLQWYLPYVSCGQPVCYALIQDGGQKH